MPKKLPLSKTTEQAQALSKKVGSTRSGRDALTRVWGGVYLEDGKVSREFNNHKTKADWADTWQVLTMDK